MAAARGMAGVVLAAALAAAPARAEIVVLQPGPEGEDVAPYLFLPQNLRGDAISLWAFTDPVHGFETFLRFELPADLVGPEEAIDLAVLSVNFALDSTPQGEGSDDPGALECREVLTPWSEMSVTWTNKPAYGPPVDVVEGIDALGPVSCDVTELVSDWVAGVRENRGFALTNPTGRLLGFYSFEAPVESGLRPALYVDVVPVPEPGLGAGGLTAAAVLAAAAARRRKGATA